jgi:hypothetical protein
MKKLNITVKLLAKAFEKYGVDIVPMEGRNFRHGVQKFEEQGIIVLFFNTPDHSTHIVSLRLNELS